MTTHEKNSLHHDGLKRCAAVALALLVCAGILVGSPATARADERIDFGDTTGGTGWTYADCCYSIYENGTYILTGFYSDSFVVIAPGITVNITLSGAEILCNNNPFKISAGATVYLTLTGANSLTASSGDYAALAVPSGATLVVTEDSDGLLTATGQGIAAGIGGGIDNTNTACGTITINGGEITANGGERGAGIGGGNGADGGKITINGGEITANGGQRGAGIGGGNNANGGEIAISGDNTTIVATGGDFGAGIGGGNNANGGEIEISGGAITAYGGIYGAGIGGGQNGDGGAITIKKGDITAEGGTHGGAGIGGGPGQPNGMSPPYRNSVGGSGGTIEIIGGEVKATGGSGWGNVFQGGAGIGGGYGSTGGTGGDITISGGKVTATGGDGGEIQAVIPGVSSGTILPGGAGIGGGGGDSTGGSGGTVTISGNSDVKAKGGIGAGNVDHKGYDIGGGGGGGGGGTGSAGIGGTLRVTGGKVALQATGTNVSKPTLENCEILGDGAGALGGVYERKPQASSASQRTDGSISPQRAAFDRYAKSAAHAGICIALHQGDHMLQAVKLNGNPLQKGEAYTTDGRVYTLKKEWLATLDAGEYVVTFDMSGGWDPSLILTIEDTTYLSWDNPFTDVMESHWFHDDVAFVNTYAPELMEGTGDHSFSPNAAVTRATLVTALWRLAGSPAADVRRADFADVQRGSAYATAVAWAVRNHVISGEGDRFGANDQLSRQDVAVMLANYMTYAQIYILNDGTLIRFADEGQIASHAKIVVQLLYKLGVLAGTELGDDGAVAVRPQSAATRVEVAAMLRRLAACVVNAE